MNKPAEQVLKTCEDIIAAAVQRELKRQERYKKEVRDE